MSKFQGNVQGMFKIAMLLLIKENVKVTVPLHATYDYRMQETYFVLLNQ